MSTHRAAEEEEAASDSESASESASGSAASEGSDSDDSSEMELAMDVNGRIPFGGTLEFGFRSFPSWFTRDVATIDRLRKDCAEVFTARGKNDSAEYSTGSTFWLPATVAPRCALEALARSVFDLHSAGAVYEKDKSGAEWWTLVMDPSDEVGFHWDKDYGLEDSGVNVMPHVSTVTYLGKEGAPTMILNKTLPMVTEESCSGQASSIMLSFPEVAKHISFDGRFLHGAPSELAGVSKEKAPEKEQKRVTFLVNVWLNHQPSTADLYPEKLLPALTTQPVTVATNEVQPTQIALDLTASTTSYSWEFKQGGHTSTLSVTTPTVLEPSGEGASVLLTLPPEHVATVSDESKPSKRRRCAE